MRVEWVVVCVLLVAAVAIAPAQAADDIGQVMLPDAGLIAKSADGVAYEGMSWQITTALDRAIWADLIQPTDRWGVGVSADITPRTPACLGVGYHPREQWLMYVGAHVGF